MQAVELDEQGVGVLLHMLVVAWQQVQQQLDFILQTRLAVHTSGLQLPDLALYLKQLLVSMPQSHQALLQRSSMPAGIHVLSGPTGWCPDDSLLEWSPCASF